MTFARATITLEGGSADVIRKALAPEAGRDVPKVRTDVRGRGRLVSIVFEAQDTSALRAAVNSYLRWADLAAGVHEVATA